MRLNPYIQFGTNAAEALDFYKSIFGGDATLNYFKEYGTEGADGDLVMHGQLETGAGFTIMGADTPSFMTAPAPGSNITVSLSGDDAGHPARLLAGPLRRRQRQHAAGEADVGRRVRQLTDKYGVGWLVNISQPQA